MCVLDIMVVLFALIKGREFGSLRLLLCIHDLQSCFDSWVETQSGTARFEFVALLLLELPPDVIFQRLFELDLLADRRAQF